MLRGRHTWRERLRRIRAEDGIIHARGEERPSRWNSIIQIWMKLQVAPGL
jgi:hypothetical protein